MELIIINLFSCINNLELADLYSEYFPQYLDQITNCHIVMSKYKVILIATIENKISFIDKYLYLLISTF